MVQRLLTNKYMHCPQYPSMLICLGRTLGAVCVPTRHWVQCVYLFVSNTYLSVMVQRLLTNKYMHCPQYPSMLICLGTQKLFIMRLTNVISQKVFTQSLLQMSIPAQIRQLILLISNNKGQVDGFVRELTFTNRLYKHIW